MDLNQLYPYQLESANALVVRAFAADLSEVGTGKTVTAMGVMKLAKAKRILVASPKSVAGQWALEFAKFWPGARVFLARDTTPAGREANYSAYLKAQPSVLDNERPCVLIATYEQIRQDIQVVSKMRFDVIYADEIHRLGNPLTRTHKAFKLLNGVRKYGATATPLRSSPLQAYGVFNWLCPGLLSDNYYKFKFRYTISTDNGGRSWVVGYKNLEELGDLMRPHYIKNLMAETGKYMPPLVEQDIIFPLSKTEQKLYDEVRKEMLLEIEKAQISKIENPLSLYNSVVKLGKLQELTDSMEMIGERRDSTKLSVLKDNLSDTLVGDNKVVVFTRFKRMANILYRELAEYSPAIITGDIQNRDEQMSRFNTDDACKVMIVTTAGNEGINLQRANILYMYDVPMGSYGSLVQTIGRIERLGQTKKMVVYYLMAENTVDIRLKNLLLTKKEMSEKMFGSLSEVKELLQ